MRIWEQGLVATYSLPGYKEFILEHYAAYQRPGTEIEIHGVRDEASATSARIAGRAVNYAYLHRFHDTQIIENVRRAEREGFDAVIIGVLQDPGLAEARTVVDIPVIGYGEVSMLAPLEYSGLIWATLFGYVFWGDLPTLTVVGGVAIIVASSAYVAHREARVKGQPTAPTRDLI